MTEKDKGIIARLSGIVDQILSGYCVANTTFDDIEQSGNPAINELTRKIVTVAQQYQENYRFMINLSSGKLNIEPPRHNSFANPFKQLHSELAHLTWQIQEIASGDYDQRVSFSGDFSDSINKMIAALREKQALANTIHENEQLFHSIFSTSPDGMLVCSLNNTIRIMSDSAKKLLLPNNEELAPNTRFVDFIADDDKEIGTWFFEELVSGKTVFSTEFKLKRKDGVKFWIEQNAGIFNDSKGSPKGIIILFRDISRRKADEEQILKYTIDLKESNATKDKLFSIIAHDLKNPFHALLGFSDILKRAVDSSESMETIKQYACIIYESATRGYDLLINLLEWSRLQSGQIMVFNETLSLLKIIKNNIDITKGSAVAKNITVYYDSEIDYEVQTDKALLDTILRNLINNAIKYTPQNGEIIVSVNPSDDFYLISVKDSGIGISEQDMKKLFRADIMHSTLGTNNEKGTGLGLVLCKDFVNKLGGSIWVESVYGQGATFTFFLPVK